MTDEHDVPARSLVGGGITPGWGASPAVGCKILRCQIPFGTGRTAPTRRVTIGAVGKLTPDQARTLAKKMLGAVAHGGDPAAEGAAERRATTLHVLAESKRKSSTATLYEDILNRLLLPELGLAASTPAQFLRK